jgi:hypothetical protein
MPSNPMLQAARNRSGPISPVSNGATKMPVRPPREHRARLDLRTESGQVAQVVAIERKHVEGVELDLHGFACENAGH